MLTKFIVVSASLFSLSVLAATNKEYLDQELLIKIRDDVKKIDSKINNIQKESIQANNYKLIKLNKFSSTVIAENLNQSNCLKTLVDLKTIEKLEGVDYKCEIKE